MVDVDDLLPISRSRGSPSAANQQRIRARTHVRGTEQPPPPRSSDAAEAQLFLAEWPPGTCISLIRDHGGIILEGERDPSQGGVRMKEGMGGPFCQLATRFLSKGEGVRG